MRVVSDAGGEVNETGDSGATKSPSGWWNRMVSGGTMRQSQPAVEFLGCFDWWNFDDGSADAVEAPL